MRQFVVPQFIDVEDKIIGPVTVRQFIIMLVDAGLIFLSYKLFDFALFVIVGLILFGIGGTIAFLKVNGQPFHFFMLNLIQTYRRPWLKIWNKELENWEIKEKLKITEVKLPEKPKVKPKISASRLAELSLIVNTGGVYEGQD
ncbi:MAG: PrgI family protein [Patescibacteria group bacterium]|nr:PrgI family protein [Patescibacteria group bacterium]MDD5490263.1 PrgI family protein [Patescibacteria group bacterium]